MSIIDQWQLVYNGIIVLMHSAIISKDFKEIQRLEPLRMMAKSNKDSLIATVFKAKPPGNDMLKYIEHGKAASAEVIRAAHASVTEYNRGARNRYPRVSRSARRNKMTS